MRDLPLALLTFTIWAYWVGVTIMVVRVRRRTRTLAGALPEDRLERRMWLVWVPVILAWLVLPLQARHSASSLLALPEVAREQPLLALRAAAALLGVICFVFTIAAWRRMGDHWRMAVRVDGPTVLITDSVFGYVRHPIYALSILLMICSVIVLPTLPMLAVGSVHVALILLKAKNEERYLLAAHGERYASYAARTGRFLPRLSRPRP